eukprot:CAMPEP_0119040364 /NCGR_PEP_ID=MMETSP1177-20130426/10259_1 /TAXON_ID=2985 /ORGANISM="Ochromonas sp, Strain CCMP1899" /LENGTH=112 /DNA_ID=CAMNT_0007005335 /DNA_START=184 /DNA_END=519 /DNA_ORIENTATION=+
MPEKARSPHAMISVVSIFLVEDLSVESMVPPEPPLEVLEDGDEDMPIAIGGSENELKNIQEWEDSRPYKGFMSIPSIDKELASEDVYTDVSAALCEAVKMSSSGPGPTPPLW